jgi:3-dehydroquinate synthase
MNFTFGRYASSVHIAPDIPEIDAVLSESGAERALLVCDTNTLPLAENMRRGTLAGLCVLPAGEQAKGWQSVETILKTASDEGLQRDGLFIAVGGGVVSDLCGFAASVYKRGAGLAIVSTTLLAMVDAAVGGKTGFDLFGIKNFAGTFYPARHVYMPLAALRTLPPEQWRSGLAEIIKTLILDDSLYTDETRERLLAIRPATGGAGTTPDIIEAASGLISRSVEVKGRIVEEDPEERGGERALLNLGHTFGHALESAAGLGRLSHGEAVAWGLARSCDLGLELDVTPPERAKSIRAVLDAFGYETASPHPALLDGEAFRQALKNDKKKKGGGICFAVPAERVACLVTIDSPDLAERIAGLV